jgi:hypothetical protein
MRAIVAITAILACTSCGCRRPAQAVAERAAPAPPERAAETAPVSAAQTAALERIGAAGGSATLDGSGLAVEIDLASERVFANEQSVLAVLEFPRLNKLRLAVSSVSAETLARLAALENLEELLLQDAPLADESLAALLQKMPQLRRLTLRRMSRVTDAGLEAVAGCGRLEVLALIEMNQLSGAGLERIARTERLRSLDLRNCGRLASGDLARLAAMARLAELKLGGPVIDDGVLVALAGLPRLESLAIEEAEVTSACLDRLAEVEGVPARLRSLALARCFGVTDETLQAIGKFPNLETLATNNILLSGAFLEALSESDGNVPPLKTLVLANGFLADETVAHLPRLFPGLVRLDLRGNLGITDKSLEVFKQLPDLKQLQLEGTAVGRERTCRVRSQAGA